MNGLGGCWTCRVRRKKCDGEYPVCGACAALRITCHSSSNRPEWMDGSFKQEEMAEHLKREVKANAPRRGQERVMHAVRQRTLSADAEESMAESLDMPSNQVPRCNPIPAVSQSHDNTTALYDGSVTCESNSWRPCLAVGRDVHETMALNESDTILLMFYLDNLFPFLFPFYRPAPLQGGRAWILKMMMSSPMLRQVTLCQSSYFFSLAQGTTDHRIGGDTILTQTRDAFRMLNHALSIINGSSITEHLQGAIRILAGIMQVQRFEIAVLSFGNCQAHLDAALVLFQQILTSISGPEVAKTRPGFNAVMNFLGLPSRILPTQSARFPSLEQAAFQFSSTLLIFDDIIASTILPEQPQLYEYHQALLSEIDGTESPLDLETVIGCQNWALLVIGEISSLDAWKQRRKRAGDLDVVDLVHRAEIIKESLHARLERVATDRTAAFKRGSNLPDVFSSSPCQRLRTSADQSVAVTQVWAHAALIYLSIVVSGWQSANCDVRHHVGQIIELLTHQISPPALLRTMVWPFCVAGCLAEPMQETQLRGLVEALQPRSFFGTVEKGLQVMENVWRNRYVGDVNSRDLASCFRYEDDLVLLV